MGVFGKRKEESQHAAGSEFAAVLPNDGRPWYRTPHLIRLNLLLVVPLFSSTTVGYDGSMMNGLQILTYFKHDFNNPAGAILGLMNAVYPLGKVIGLFVVTPVADRFGRKMPMAIGLVGCIVFAIVQGLSPNLAAFVIARAFLGFWTSFVSQPSPVLIAELAYPTQRGKLTSLYNTFFYFGAIFAAWLTFGTFKINSTWSWRIPSMVQGAIPVVQLAALWFMPESPRYLVSRGRSDEARRDLIKHHAGGDADSPLVAFEMAEIERAMAAEKSESYSANSWLDLFRGAANRRRTLIAIIVGIFSQWNGVGVVSYYLTLVLNTIGITDPRDQTLINGMLQIFNWLMATFAGAMMVDRLGRRTLFLISTSGMLVSYICWTGLTSGFVTSKDQGMGRAVLAFIFIFYFFYDVAWTPLFQAYPVIYPYTLRSRGLSITLITSFTGLIIGNQVNPIAMDAIQWKYYIVFCCLLAVLLVLIYFLFPETKGRTLEEIREVFEGPATSTAMDPKVEEAAGRDDGDGHDKAMQSKHVEAAK